MSQPPYNFLCPSSISALRRGRQARAHRRAADVESRVARSAHVALCLADGRFDAECRERQCGRGGCGGRQCGRGRFFASWWQWWQYEWRQCDERHATRRPAAEQARGEHHAAHVFGGQLRGLPARAAVERCRCFSFLLPSRSFSLTLSLSLSLSLPSVPTLSIGQSEQKPVPSTTGRSPNRDGNSIGRYRLCVCVVSFFCIRITARSIFSNSSCLRLSLCFLSLFLHCYFLSLPCPPFLRCIT